MIKVVIKAKFPFTSSISCLLSGSICLLLCVMSLMFCHNAGNYTFTIYDNFCGSIPLLVIALFECLGVAYCYGLQRFSEDIELMTGTRPGLFLCLCWKYVSPAIMTAILVSFFTKMIFGDLSYEVYIRPMMMM